MPGLKIAIQLSSLRLPLRKALITASRLGAKAVEIDGRGEINPKTATDTAVRDLKRMLEDLNLTVAAVGFPTRRGYDVAEDIDRRVAATKAAQKFARSLGAPLVINQIGRVPAESSGKAWTLLLESLTDLANHGQKFGALLAAQTGTEDPSDLKRLLDALPPHGIAVDLDPGALIINGFSPLEAATVLGPQIMHVHARDAVRDLARGRGLEVQLGRGAADMPNLLGVLEQYNYRGYVTTVARENTADPVEEAGEAVEYLKSL